MAEPPGGPHVPPGLAARVAIGPVRLLGVPVTALARLSQAEHERRRELGLWPGHRPGAARPPPEPARRTAGLRPLGLGAGRGPARRHRQPGPGRAHHYPEAGLPRSSSTPSWCQPARAGWCGRSRMPACSPASPGAGPLRRARPGALPGSRRRSAVSGCSARTAPSSSRQNPPDEPRLDGWARLLREQAYRCWLARRSRITPVRQSRPGPRAAARRDRRRPDRFRRRRRGTQGGPPPRTPSTGPRTVPKRSHQAWSLRSGLAP